MHTDDVFAILAKYCDANDLDGKSLDELLVTVCDKESIALKLSEGARISTSETVRTILDVTEIAYSNVKGTHQRVIPIGEGVTGLFGPNDSGKTTAQLAAGWILGGVNAFKRGLDEKMLRHGAEEMTGKATFAGDHDRFIKRSLSTRIIKKGKEAGQSKTDRALLVKLNGHTEDKPAKAQAEIDTYLGADLDFVMSVAFLQQGQIPQLLDADPAERKTAVYQLLGLHIAEETAKKLRAVHKRWMDARDADVVNRAHLVKQKTALEEKVKQIPSRDKLQAELERLAPMATAADASTAAQRGTLQKRMAEIDAEPAMRIATSDEPVAVPAAEAEVKKFTDALKDATAKVEVLRAKYREIHALPNVCPTCAVMGKTCEVPVSWKADELAKIQAAGKVASACVAASTTDLAGAQQTLDSLRNFEEQRQANRARRKMLTEERARLVTQLDGLPAGAVPDASSVEAYAWAQAKIKELDALVEAIASTDRSLARIDADAPVLMEGWTGAIERETMALACEAFSKDGIPLWLARTHIGRVNALAAEMAAGDRYTFRFNQELAVEVIDTHRDNANVVPQLASGSSRERGALVLAAAMSKYQQQLAGIACHLLWIDELPFQDAVNSLAVADTIKRLAKWFPRIVFAASDWEAFQGVFDHEVFLKNELLEQQVEAQRASGSVALSSTTAEIKLRDEKPKGDYTKMVEEHAKSSNLKDELAALESEIGSGDPGF
jgi:hypothetical protein